MLFFKIINLNFCLICLIYVIFLVIIKIIRGNVKVFKFLLLAVCSIFPFVLSGCENNNTTSLSTPKNLEIKNGIISFKQVEDADFYSISVNDKVFSVDAKHNSNVTLVDGLVKYDANRLFAYGNTYSIKVKARGSERYDSHYTAVVEYLHNIDLRAPTNVRISSETLAWDNVSDASYYVVKAYYKTGNNTQEEIAYKNSSKISGFLETYGTGEYQFSVKAIREGINPAESTYSDVANYVNYKPLLTPKIVNVYMSGNELKMSVVDVDANMQKLTIKCGDIVKDVEKNPLSGEYTTIFKEFIIPELEIKPELSIQSKLPTKPIYRPIKEHYIFNLTKIFGESTFEDLKQYVFTIQAKIENSSTYYTNSETSEQFEYNKTQTLDAPTLSVELDAKSNKFIASWNAIENAIGYEIEINGEVIFVDNLTANFLIEDSNFTIKVRAVGAGNYISSEYSNSITK